MTKTTTTNELSWQQEATALLFAGLRDEFAGTGAEVVQVSSGIIALSVGAREFLFEVRTLEVARGEGVPRD